MKNDFLKNLQNSLESGKKNDDVVNHLNEIHEKADEITPQDVAEHVERVKNTVVKGEKNEKVREKAEEEYIKIMAEQKVNDEKLRFLALIEQRNVEIIHLKEEFETVKIKYSKKIEDVNNQKITLMVEFEKKYEKKAEEFDDFGREIDTKLE